MTIIAHAVVPQQCRATRPAPSESTVDLQKVKAANGKATLYGAAEPRIVPADAPCPPWCTGNDLVCDDDGAHSHSSRPRIVIATSGPERREMRVEVARLDVPGQPVDVPEIRMNDWDAMTQQQALQLAAALVAAVQDAQRDNEPEPAGPNDCTCWATSRQGCPVHAVDDEPDPVEWAREQASQPAEQFGKTYGFGETEAVWVQNILSDLVDRVADERDGDDR